MPRDEFRIVPIKQIDIYTAVREQLSALIRDGGYSPGDRLPSERSLASDLNVSRMAVREAMKVLEYQGQVEIRKGSGTFVAHPGADPVAALVLNEFAVDTAFLNHLAELRGTLECRLVELAVERATEADIAHLGEVIKRIEEEHLPDAELGSLNLLFEAAIARAARNPVMASMQRTVHELWVEAWGRFGLTPDSKVRLHEEHLSIYRALADRDATAATALMRAHVERLVAVKTEQLGLDDDQ